MQVEECHLVVTEDLLQLRNLTEYNCALLSDMYTCGNTLAPVPHLC